jgi:hypothetical protein
METEAKESVYCPIIARLRLGSGGITNSHSHCGQL